MKIRVSRTRTFSPEILGNKLLPAEEQMEVTFTKPNAVQKKEWEKRIYTPSLEGNIGFHTEHDVRAIILGSEVKIINFDIENEKGEVISIKDGETLLKQRSDVCNLLVNQIVREIMTPDITEEMIKN